MHSGAGLFLCLLLRQHHPSQEMPSSPHLGLQHHWEKKLHANFFEMDISKIDIYHYELDIKPEKCPQRVNREMVEHTDQDFKTQIFGDQKSVFGGTKNLYTGVSLPIGRDKVELEVTLPEGKDRYL